MEEKIHALIADTINTLGFELVKVSIHGTADKIIEVLIERLNGERIQVNDCRLVSTNISAILDVEDIMHGKYLLEVSSAGLERPLVKPDDFEKFKGREIKVRLKTVYNNQLSFRGKSLGLLNQCLIIDCKGDKLSFDLTNIKSAKLVLTDEMFRALLNKKQI